MLHWGTRTQKGCRSPDVHMSVPVIWTDGTFMRRKLIYVNFSYVLPSQRLLCLILTDKEKKQIMTMIFLFLKSINVDLLRQSASAKNIFITGITVSVLWFRLYSPKERKKINYLNNNITYNNNNYNKQCQIRIHKLFLFACFFCENSHKIVHEKKIQHIFF